MLYGYSTLDLSLDKHEWTNVWHTTCAGCIQQPNIANKMLLWFVVLYARTAVMTSGRWLAFWKLRRLTVRVAYLPLQL